MTSRKLPTANQIAARLHDYGTSQLHADADERLRLMEQCGRVSSDFPSVADALRAARRLFAALDNG